MGYYKRGRVVSTVELLNQGGENGRLSAARREHQHDALEAAIFCRKHRRFCLHLVVAQNDRRGLARDDEVATIK
jgi:hypothetical protein